MNSGIPDRAAPLRVEIETAIRHAIRSTPSAGKTGKSHLESAVAHALRNLRLEVDPQDGKQFLRGGMPAWRSKETRTVESTAARRLIDVVAYDAARPVALVEVESDLDDLRSDGGITRRSGHYDVFSISRRADGAFFDSYKSLERMATAAFYWHQLRTTAQYPSPVQAELSLGAIASDNPADHNPEGLAMFLVVGRARPHDPAILDARLRSIGARLVTARVGTR